MYTEIKSFSLEKKILKAEDKYSKKLENNVCNTHNKELYFKELLADVPANYKQSNKKWPKDIKRQSAEKRGNMSNKYMKLCHLRSKIKTKMSYHF